MDPLPRRASRRRNDDVADVADVATAAAAAGRGWADVATVTLGPGYPTTMIGLTAVHVSAAVADVVMIPDITLMPVVPLVGASILVLLWVHHLRRPCTGPTLMTRLGLVWALVTVVVGAHLVVGSDPMYAVYLTLTLVAAGALVPQVRWLLVCDVVAAAATAVVVVPRFGELHPQMAVVSVAFAITVAHLLQRHAYRGRRQLQVLASALATAEMTDPLTRLANRQGLAEGLEQMLDLDSAAGDGPADGRSIVVLCFDVDGFKGINDELGHSTGDAVLVEVAERLRELVREGDVVARLGGDEFALVLADVAPAEAGLVAERARLRLRGSAGVLDMPWSVSVGMVCADVSAVGAVEDLLRRADLAMYEDKRARRGAAARRRATGTTTTALSAEA